MNHQPFRDWLLSDDELQPDQAQQLHEHLSSCESCKQIEASWLDVESVIEKTPQVAPSPGFTKRWQAHFAEYQDRKQRQHGWLTIGITALIVTVLLGLTISQVWVLIETPGPYLAMVFKRFLSLLSIYYSLQNLINPFSWSIPVYTFIGSFSLVE
jgi:hypothetical protein